MKQNYEMYPIHCLESGIIIDEDNYNSLPEENRKKFEKTNRCKTAFISMRDGIMVINYYDLYRYAQEYKKHFGV